MSMRYRACRPWSATVSCRFARYVAAFAALAGACGDGTQPASGPELPGPAASNSLLPPNTALHGGCGGSGYLRAMLYGALSAELEWTGETMDCEGMPRPDGRGARLRFAGAAGDTALPLAIIIAIPALARAETAKELPSNVTVIEEGIGRFFSTADLDNCWTDIDRHAASASKPGRFAVAGTLYCISPLPEMSGSGGVSIPELRFSGIVDWGSS